MYKEIAEKANLLKHAKMLNKYKILRDFFLFIYKICNFETRKRRKWIMITHEK